MRLFLTILGNFFVPTVVGGGIFGMVMAANITLHENRPEDTLPAMAFMGLMSSIFAFFIFLVPGLAYSFFIGILSVAITDGHVRRWVITVVALVAGFTLFPLFIWLGDTGFKNAWWIIALISGPLFVCTAYLLDRITADQPKPNKPRHDNHHQPPCFDDLP
jgi:hypothetical protein